MIKILFICHGNICRSPMGEMIMKQLVRERHLENRFTIASCATTGRRSATRSIRPRVRSWPGTAFPASAGARAS